MPLGPYVSRLSGRVSLVSWLSNVAGAVLAFLFLTFLSPDRSNRPFGRNDAISGAVFVAYVIFTGVAGYWSGRMMFVRIGEWATGPNARPPDAESRDMTLGLPARVARRAFYYWIGGAVVFMGLNIAFDTPSFEVLRLVIGILVAGTTSAALTFVLIERLARPLFALALAGETPDEGRFLGIRPRLMLAWALGSALPLISIGSVIASPRVDAGSATIPVLFLTGVGLGAGWLMMFVSSRSIADPLRTLRHALSRVETGDLTAAVTVDDGGEVGRLQEGFNQMASGLRERHELEELFGRHVGTDVAKLALDRRALGGEQLQASALFVDLTGSTQMALSQSPVDVVRTLNAFFEMVVKAVDHEGGWVNKFQGDGALCVFGAPAEQPDHAARALRAACSIHRGMAELQSQFPGLDAGVGVSSGPVVAGNVGSADRYEYTVIGDPVNEAARLTEAAKGDPSRVLAGQRTINAAGPAASGWEEAGVIELRGRVGATRAFHPTAG